ncbi:unnamed protein product [Schistosoma curassoni]|uniref:RGS domain-containing protein n=1 Tax=Schistosoma curassoni TaxID=6186 RepID=A0A183JJJ4_9TREM|nr:unnamed protein product [Schistosoma curassoni]
MHSDFDAFEDYLERFEIWDMNEEDVEENIIVAHSLTLIGKEAYSLLKTLASPEMPITFPYLTLKKLLIDYVKYTNFKCGKEGKFRKMIHQDIKNSTTLLRHPDPSVCNTTVHSAATNAKIYNRDLIKSGCSNDHSSLFTTSKSDIESHSNPELNETQIHCEKKVTNLSTSYRISHVIVPDMVCLNDSYISDEISYESEENMLDESSHDRKPDAVLIDADFSNDSLVRNDILNTFEENISEESNLVVISYITSHNAFASCGKLVQCESRTQNENDFNYSSDDLISTVVYPYHEVTSNEYTSQCMKYVLNEATSFIIWGYEDPTLFRGGG